MTLGKISIYIVLKKCKNQIQKVHYLQSYFILKDNSIKERIFEAVRVNGGHCGGFIP